ncbi:MAG: hypothetical protein COA57_11915 [Flavobacteriales bacterium]|nr:hypothetical protein [Bacteroidales bacterium AH-315-I05]PCJ83142.1 MAG: hypothetical protein COA57_11915 [Flavobacteriales bacterium]
MENLKALACVVLVSLFFGACGGPAGQQDDNDEGKNVKPLLDSTKSALFQVGDELFSIPSPMQTAMLIKASGANYNSEMLNNPGAAGQYSTKVQKSLNLGIYGADLGYVTLYDQTQDAVSYINAAKKLADDLGVSSAFNPALIKRFQNNLGNKDSLLLLVSDAYMASDAYLKDNQREDISSLVLAGGWMEALYFATEVAKMANSPEINRRIGEQKNTLENLIKLLQKKANNEEYAELVDQLVDLYYMFDDVEYSYEYEKPSTDEEKKLTIINSGSVVNITEDQLNQISAKIKSIRNQIVG